ncbi:hypothetical protein BC937DRAFT_91841 [Endogone sp. FLAS-F59071]|nr:hypothetical protein BC937DRAFT_91841 [Endogone sp. FLAS-F59071]|eukprot:RUS23154.1 hypothetical protein BC937DRAFT_91841 [Endogone sp. FLAS-F59071]
MATNPNGNNPETAAARAAQQVADLLRSHLQNLEAQSEAELHEANQERAVADAQFTENESSLREAQEMLRQAQITLDETARDYEQIQQDLQRAEEELRSLTAELEGLIKQEQRLKQDIVAIQATQNNQVQEQEHIAGQLRQTEKEIADITAKMEKLQRELNDAQRKSSTLQREIDQARHISSLIYTFCSFIVARVCYFQLESLVEDLDQNISEQEQLKSQTQSKLQETEHDMDMFVSY